MGLPSCNMVTECTIFTFTLHNDRTVQNLILAAPFPGSSSLTCCKLMSTVADSSSLSSACFMPTAHQVTHSRCGFSQKVCQEVQQQSYTVAVWHTVQSLLGVQQSLQVLLALRTAFTQACESGKAFAFVTRHCDAGTGRVWRTQS